MIPNVYIRMPKCASTSIMSVFEQAGLWDEEKHGWDCLNEYGFACARANLNGNDLCGPREWEPSMRDLFYSYFDSLSSNFAFTWTVVRNPFDRAVSAFLYGKQQGWLSETCTFLDYILFLRGVYSGPPYVEWAELVSWLCESDLRGFPVMGQSFHDNVTLLGGRPEDGILFEQFFVDADAYEILRSAFAHGMNWESTVVFNRIFNLYEPRQTREIKELCTGERKLEGISLHDLPKTPKKLDFVIRFERLQEDFALLCEKINLDFDASMFPHKQKNLTSCRKRYQDYYDDTTIEQVRALYQHEITTFGYKFDD